MAAAGTRRFPHRHRASARRQGGLAAVEFAIVAAVLVLILLVAADFGRIFYVSIGVVNAARAGAQYGIRTATTFADLAGMQTAAVNDASDISGLTATATNFCECVTGTEIACAAATCSSPRRYVRVVATASFDTLTAYPGLPTSVTLTRSAVMRAP